jgi:cobalt-zinc-cadmium efflux system outer membrane protein
MFRSITPGIAVAVALSASACSPGLVGANRDAYLNYRQVTQEPSFALRPAVRTESVTLPESPTLDDYLTVALTRNPGLRQARLEAEASGHAIAQITGLPDPQVGFVPPTGDLIQTAAGQIDSSIGISQQIPFPGKLYVRGKAAAHAAAATREAYRSSRLQLIADVRRAYYMLYFADRAIEITSKSRGLLRDFRSIAARKYEAGKVPQQDVLRAQVELTNLENELLTLSRTRRTARARLNRLMS